MNKSTIRFLTAILALSLTFGIGTSCGGDAPVSGDTTTTVATETADPNAPDIPDDLNFGDKTVNIFNFDSGSWNNQLVAESQNGEVLNDAIYAAQIAVEERLNVTLSEYRGEGDWSGAFSEAQKILAAGDDAYHIYFQVDRNALIMAQEGYLEPLQNMPYVDLDREYWAQSVNHDLSIAGNLYFSYGDFNLTGYECVNALLVNKSMITDFGLGNHYDMVLDGSWTLDVMNNNMLTVAQDLNGDNKYDDQDRYGITSHNKQVLPNFWIAAGLRSIEKNDEDLPVFALPGNEAFAVLYDRILSMMYDNPVYFNSKVYPDYANNTLFINGQSLYNIVRIAFMRFYRDMDYDYAIIPYPKADKAQTDYYSRFEGGAVNFTPKLCVDKELAGAVMEQMAYEYQKTVIPAYYDVVLKNKYTRDEKSVEMLDIIYENRICDLGDTIWSNAIRDGVFAGKFDRNDRNLQSTISSMTPKVENTISQAIEAFSTIE